MGYGCCRIDHATRVRAWASGCRCGSTGGRIEWLFFCAARPRNRPPNTHLRALTGLNWPTVDQAIYGGAYARRLIGRVNGRVLSPRVGGSDASFRRVPTVRAGLP